jgi:GcrA cell cycle regulator
MPGSNFKIGTEWTLDHIAELTRLLPTGMVYRDIAKTLNEQFGTAFSKNSVVGKVHRLGLTPPEKPKAEPRVRTYSPRVGHDVKAKRAAHSNTIRIVSTVVLEREKLRCLEIKCTVPLLDVTGCRYTDGDGPFLFCDGPQHPGSSFCFSHHVLCWVPARNQPQRVAA